MALLAVVLAATWFVTTALPADLPRLLEAFGAASGAAVAAGVASGPAQVGARLLEFGFVRRFHPLISARLGALAHPLGAAALFDRQSGCSRLYCPERPMASDDHKGTLPLAVLGSAGCGV
jgi:hypothetical protein